MSDDILEIEMSKEELEHLIIELPQILKELEEGAIKDIVIEKVTNL
ncbi:hypothetical protein [Pelosinus sp. UFO1]|nr:hypothetical protein [Pelosinus sp. UFO1]AIF50588.1 hypothetical protein UFO1_1033 [Pelosinus sp. UFO1]